MINNPLTRRRPAAAAEPIAEPNQLLAGITEAETNRARIQAELQAGQARLKALTAQEERRRERGPLASRSNDLEAILDDQAVGDRLKREIAASNDRIIELFHDLRTARDDVAARRADLDEQLRPLHFRQRQERIGGIAVVAMDLGDRLEADRLANAAAEQQMLDAGLRPLGFSNVLVGIDGRLNGWEGQAAPLHDAMKEWADQDWLVGAPAVQAEARTRLAFQEREEAHRREAERRAEVERQAKESERLWRRERLASGEIKVSVRMSDGNWKIADPETAVRRYDEQCGVVPRRKRDAAPSAGELVGV